MSLFAMYMSGRWGNWLFQDAFARVFAFRHGMQLLTPIWPGQYLFGLTDELPFTQPEQVEGPNWVHIDERQLPQKADQSVLALLVTQTGCRVQAHVSAKGFFQFPSAFYAPFRDRLRKSLTTIPDLQRQLDAALEGILQNRPFAAIHLRKGDFRDLAHRGGPFEIVPDEWYLQWLRQRLGDSAIGAVYVATDEPESLPAGLAELGVKVVTARDLSGLPDLPGANVFTDWYVLGAAPVVAIANSSFSFSATMFNSREHQRCWRPDRTAGHLVPYDPWNAEVILHPGRRQ